MKKTIFLLMLIASLARTYAQKSAEAGDFNFVTGKDDGNKKFIKYTAFNLTYSPVTYQIDSYEGSRILNLPSFHVTWESYNTYSRRFAGSTELNAGMIDDNFIGSIDYGLYLIMFKGLYLKVKIGYGILSDVSTGETPTIVTYGGDLGYLFTLRNVEGKRPVFLSLFGGYDGYTGSSNIEHTYHIGNYEFTYSNTYTGGGFKAGIKFMMGPKN